jgi:hypothetical protein
MRQMAVWLATAALVLLVLASSLLVLGPGRPGRQDDAPLLLPALSVTPAAETAVTETLFDAAVDGLPTGWGQSLLVRWTLRPSSQALIFPPTMGAQVFKVESGAVTVTEDGVEHPLAAGEVYVVTNPAQEVAFRLSDTEEATLLRGMVVSSWESAAADRFVTSYEHLLENSTSMMPGGSGRLVARQLTLPSGTALAPQEANPLDWFGIGAGTLGLTLEGDALPNAWTAGEEKSLTRESLWPQVPADTRMTLRNASDAPLVLYRMTLMPDGAATSSGTPVS